MYGLPQLGGRGSPIVPSEYLEIPSPRKGTEKKLGRRTEKRRAEKQVRQGRILDILGVPAQRKKKEEAGKWGVGKGEKTAKEKKGSVSARKEGGRCSRGGKEQENPSTPLKLGLQVSRTNEEEKKKKLHRGTAKIQKK